MKIAKQIKLHRSLSKLAIDALKEKLNHEVKLIGYSTMQQIETFDDIEWEHEKETLIEIHNLSHAIRTIEKSVDTAISSLKDIERDLEANKERQDGTT